MRTVIVHYHLFKNAGTTLDSILHRSVPPDAHGYIEGPHAWSTVSPSELLDFALSNPGYQVISSHQARLPLPEDPQIRFIPLLLLRHPIDRFGSVYEFERRQPIDSNSPSVAIARQGGLAEFADWVVSPDASAVCRNYQVLHLSGRHSDMRTARATHLDYQRALEHLKALPVFGTVETFDATLEAVRNLLRPYAIELSHVVRTENVSGNRLTTIAERLAHIERELGPARSQALLEHNALDLLLYEQAQMLSAQIQEKLTRGHGRFRLPSLGHYLKHFRFAVPR